MMTSKNKNYVKRYRGQPRPRFLWTHNEPHNSRPPRMAFDAFDPAQVTAAPRTNRRTQPQPPSAASTLLHTFPLQISERAASRPRTCARHGLVRHALLDLVSHCHECLLDVCGILGTRLQKLHADRGGELLRGLEAY